LKSTCQLAPWCSCVGRANNFPGWALHGRTGSTLDAELGIYRQQVMLINDLTSNTWTFPGDCQAFTTSGLFHEHFEIIAAAPHQRDPARELFGIIVPRGGLGELGCATEE